MPGATATELDRILALDVERDWRFFEGGIAAWIVQTFLALRDSDQPVEIANRFDSRCINFAHVSQLRQLERPRGCFVVGIRADYPPVRWCQYHVVQNQMQVGPRTAWLPHWPQPGLIPRDPGRGARIERVGYFGRTVNHYTRFFRRASGYFRVRNTVRDICFRLGIDLVERGPDRWNDYSDVDVVLGIRDFGDKPYNNKPPTKIVNAWLADALFIGGSDSAFLQVGKPGVDFLRATRPEMLERHLCHLITRSIAIDRMKTRNKAASISYHQSN
ncbi:MAG: hypothetical protein HKP13_05520, partial [Gammaproteobacteria bacterium]|nr:hypothetical protein [Gammaproteobacteria bacterium]